MVAFVLVQLINKHPNAFVFWDAGKNTIKVMHQIKLSYECKIRYIAFHDSGKIQRSVRRAIKKAEFDGMYRIVHENLESDPKKGITIMKLVDYEK